MSSYTKLTKHPLTGSVEEAYWLDDYFGSHEYGVHFPSDDKVFKASEFQWESHEDHERMAQVAQVVDIPQKVTVAMYDKGKRTITTKHADGRQDVTVEVTRLDLKDRTPEDTAAEAKIIEALSKKVVQVAVLHKPSMQTAKFDSPLPEVRKRALAVIKVFNKPLVAEKQAPLSDFVVLQSDSEITISTL